MRRHCNLTDGERARVRVRGCPRGSASDGGARVSCDEDGRRRSNTPDYTVETEGVETDAPISLRCLRRFWIEFFGPRGFEVSDFRLHSAKSQLIDCQG